jgi:hypothetical protein
MYFSSGIDKNHGKTTTDIPCYSFNQHSRRGPSRAGLLNNIGLQALNTKFKIQNEE